ncbi:S-adenosyl-L-methionine-dependent methyltransferase [Massariosphaeria phaeospora]|uniref:S-adenosyl-L-methionine-dependent methyltransferase n=1 Tax=Massariosphaeria phaeospora TaxID=100035 RepID=A0A7C8IM19_9PLEO|nr:S-adenosyl-L-methionine-dependent methyltransferase [Massariosphaeria phaeospora]
MPKMLEEERDIAVDSTYDAHDYDDDDDDDDRLTYTSGQTLASSVTRYRYENGRRYHAYLCVGAGEGSYYGPNDERYSQYETIVHHLWLLTFNDKLFLAPIENPETILDVGTGTGLWAIDMADFFPSAEIIGTDLSPTQVSSAPPNVRFEVDDACSEWTYPAASFSYIHVRGLTGCISSWPTLYAQALTHLKPGGWLEHSEFGIDTNANPASDDYAHRMYSRFSASIIAVGEEKTGMTFKTVERMRGEMEAAGFVDVVERKFLWPIGTWPKERRLKELGRWGERNWSEGIEGWVLALYTRVLGWSYTEVQSFVADFKAVIKDRKNHFYHEVRCVYGRKPFPHEIPTATTANASTSTTAGEGEGESAGGGGGS